MKPNTKKCKNCGTWNGPLISSYYRGKKGRVSVIKQRKEPLYIARKVCINCGKQL